LTVLYTYLYSEALYCVSLCGDTYPLFLRLYECLAFTVRLDRCLTTAGWIRAIAHCLWGSYGGPVYSPWGSSGGPVYDSWGSSGGPVYVEGILALLNLCSSRILVLFRGMPSPDMRMTNCTEVRAFSHRLTNLFAGSEPLATLT
jgi:hypothetical protein